MAVKSSPTKPAARQPRAPKSASNARPRPPRNNERFAHDLWGLGLLGFAGVLLASLLSRHHAGALGDFLRAMAFNFVGIGAYLMPLLFGAIGIMLIQGREQHTRANFAGGSAALYLILISLWHLARTSQTTQFESPERYGGYAAGLIIAGLRALVNDVSCAIILVILAGMAIVWLTDMRLLHLYDKAATAGKRISAPVTETVRSTGERASAFKERAAERASERDAEREAKRIANVQRAFEREAAKPKAKPVLPPMPDMAPAASIAPSVPMAVAPMSVPEPPKALVREEPTRINIPPISPPLSQDDDMPTVPRALPPVTMPIIPIIEQPKPVDDGPLKIPELLGNDGTKNEYVLPPLTLLNESPPAPPRQEADMQQNQAILMQTLNDFKIGANVAQVAIGPTVTRYEVQLEPGILVKKIVSLADNLAMSLAAIDVRVEAPIPGKSAIGIEVPNAVRQMVTLRECMSTNEFMNAPSKLTFALGKDVSGQFKYADLTRMPHLLVGGSTNSGKSVCLNVLITSILYRATPREVKFIMIDPKRVELSLYDGIPHLLAPVIKDVKQAAGILRSVLKEMEERYDRFARLGTRNIEGFNNRVPPEERLPFIVVVIDELADLMMQQGPEVETSICRLAQLARATGIHLVIATQRPSVDVITGTIKSNIGSRIAFSVATQIDSRTILDQAGADRLIGRGDMLFMPIDAAKPVRIQGCYLGEHETDDVVKYLRDQEEAVYTMIPSDSSASGFDELDEDDGSSDVLFEPCVRWLVMQGQCSTSSLQRKFKIGYTRAARLVEIMEARHIVGSQEGVKPREILLRAENVDVFFAGSPTSELGR